MDFSSLSAGDRIRIILELIGGPQYSAGMQSAAAQTAKLGTATTRAGRASVLAGQRTFFYNQALFTLRRYAFYATLALTALGGMAVKTGFSYLAAMQQGRIMLTQFLGSTRAANTELAFLYKQTIYTPFVFKDIVNATNVMLRLGVSLTDTNRTIKNMGDALAGLPNASQRLLRASYALGHMATLGRVTGRVLQQLSMDNIPMVAALESQFHLTGQQIQNISRLGIPASAALGALNNYIQGSAKYSGMALKITMGSLPGLFAAFKDFSAQMLGTVFAPLYSGLQGLLLTLVKPGGLLASMQAAAGPTNNVGRALGVLDNYVGAHGSLRAGLTHVATIVRDLWKIFLHGFLPALGFAVVIISHMLPFLKTFAWLLGVLAHHTTILTVLLIPFATLWVASHSIMMATFVATKLLTVATFGLSVAETRLAFRTKIALLWQLRSLKALREWAFATTAVRSATGIWTGGLLVNNTRMAKFTRFVFTAASAIKAFTLVVWANTIALLSNPITWIVLGVIALVAVLVTLFFKWKAFHDKVVDFGTWIKTHWPAISNAFVGPLEPLVKFSNVLVDIIKNSRILYGWLKRISDIGPKINLNPTAGAHGAGQKVLDMWNWMIGIRTGNFPGHAFGGTQAIGGYATVGEHGPELIRLPAQASIVSNELAPSALASFSGGNGQPIVVNVQVDRKTIARAVARGRADAESSR